MDCPFWQNYEINLLDNLGDVLYLTDDANKINSPKLLEKHVHAQVLVNLRKALLSLKNAGVKNSDIMRMRVRNWLFLYEESELVIDIILDKGYSLADVEANIIPRQAETTLTYDECAEFHEYLLLTDIFDIFAENVNIRVGSPGSEPILYDLEDYEASVGDVLKVETWEKIAGRSKYIMVLNEIYDNKGHKVIVLVEGIHRFEIPIENIKTAFAVPLHPLSKSLKLAKSAARRKARSGVFKKSK